MSEHLIKNAIITSTMLGFEGHSVMTGFLFLDYGDSTLQSFGGYRLDAYNKATQRTEGHAFGIAFIGEVLNTVGVSKWEDLAGKYIRVECDWNKVYRIGHITKNVWLDPAKLAEDYK